MHFFFLFKNKSVYETLTMDTYVFRRLVSIAIFHVPTLGKPWISITSSNRVHVRIVNDAFKSFSPTNTWPLHGEMLLNSIFSRSSKRETRSNFWNTTPIEFVHYRTTAPVIGTPSGGPSIPRSRWRGQITAHRRSRVPSNMNSPVPSHAHTFYNVIRVQDLYDAV